MISGANDFRKLPAKGFAGRFCCFAAIAAICCFSAGCGGPKDKIKVSGTVSWNGVPIKDGSISFKPLDAPQYGPEAAPIVDGRFSFYVRAGKNRVEICATKEAGYSQVMRQQTFVQFLPAEYNVESKLEKEVVADGNNNFEFALTGK